MKRIAAVLLVLTFGGASAFGGVVEFSPDPLDLMVSGPMTGSLDVTVTGVGQFDSLDMVIGSDDFTITGFTYDAAIDLDSTTAPYMGVGLYTASDVWIGGFNDAGHVSGPTMLVGTVDVDLTGLPEGTYEIEVSATRDGDISGLGVPGVGFDGLAGIGIVNVVPEPATLGLLGLASLGFLRRRK
jgi:hypothetical protein